MVRLSRDGLACRVPSWFRLPKRNDAEVEEGCILDGTRSDAPEKVEGPFVQAAFLCERVLQEQDGVISIIRIVDRFTTIVHGPQAPESMPSLPLNATLFICLKSGFVRGRHDIEVEIFGPSGQPVPPGKLSVPTLFEGDADRGVNLILPFGFMPKEEGLYWFDIRFEKRTLTRVPLRLVFQPLPTSGPPAPP